jgi:DNA polymerase-4
MERYIVHVDMDAFFASVEQRDDPSLRGKPVIIGADPRNGKGRGVVSTCSYEARRYGVRSAMPISKAWQLCPRGVYLQPDMRRYSEASSRLLALLNDFTPDIEPVSIDEAFLDISGSWHLFETPVECCRRIKARIRSDLGLTASVGMAPVKMAAKIASDLNKPDGLTIVGRGEVKDFLAPLAVERLWGVGPKTAQVLKKAGIRTIGVLAGMDVKVLTSMLGERHGVHLLQLANGVDERPVSACDESKSVSQEYTFEVDIDDDERVRAAMMHLSEEVSWRLRRNGYRGKTVTLKIRLSGFETFTRSQTLDNPTNFSDVIYGIADRLYGIFDRKGRKVRLIGVKVEHFDGLEHQFDMFDTQPVMRRELLHQALDRLRQRFGFDTIGFARGMIEKDDEKDA